MKTKICRWNTLMLRQFPDEVRSDVRNDVSWLARFILLTSQAL